RPIIVSLKTAVAITVGWRLYFAARSRDRRASAPLSTPEPNGALWPNTVTRRFGSICCGRADATTMVSGSDALSRFSTNATGDNMPPAVAVSATVSASDPFDVDRVCDSEAGDAPKPSICTSRKWLTRMPYVPCVLTALAAPDHLLTTVSLTRNSIEAPATRTSRTLTDRPLASGFLTPSDAVFGRMASVVASPALPVTSHA